MRRVAGLSSAFVELGVKPGDRVGLFAANRPEWHTADFAITGAGGVTVPIYFNESPERITYILKHCGAKFVFAAGTAQMQKLQAVRAQLPELEQIVIADCDSDLPADYLRYETLIAAAGGRRCCSIPNARFAGPPRPARFAHLHFRHDRRAKRRHADAHEFLLERRGLLRQRKVRVPRSDVAISFLPLAHVYGRMLDYTYLFHGITLLTSKRSSKSRRRCLRYIPRCWPRCRGSSRKFMHASSSREVHAPG